MTLLLQTIPRILPFYGSRILEDGPTAAELQLEADYAAEIDPALAMAYLYAINRLQPMYGASEAEIKQALLDMYQREDLYSSTLYDVVSYNGRAAYNIGGRIGLDTLGLDGTFDLQDPEISGNLEPHYLRLSDIDGEYSLLDTTAGEVAQQARMAADGGQEWDTLYNFLTLWYRGRVAIRSYNIANTETVRMSRIGLLASFIGNGVTGVIHRTAGDDRVCPICQPLNGKQYTAANIYDPLSSIGADQIPLHGRCRCYYEPIRKGWVIPAVIWTGFELGDE